MFGRFWGSSKNVLTNLAICQESLIRHLGIIKTQNEPHNKPDKQMHTYSFAVFCTLLDTVFWTMKIKPPFGLKINGRRHSTPMANVGGTHPDVPWTHQSGPLE